MNAVFAAEEPGRIKDALDKFKRVFYYSGIRANEAGTEQWEADRKVKSAVELHLIETLRNSSRLKNRDLSATATDPRGK